MSPRMPLAERRRRNRIARQARADARLQQKLLTSTRCPKAHGQGRCNGELETRIGKLGETIVVCLACERQKQGLCRRCPNRVAGKSLRFIYCSRCAPIAQREKVRAYENRNREKVRERARQYVADLTPEERARRNEYKRLYRLANPEKVRAQKKRYVQRMRDKKSSAYITYHRRYNRKHGEFYKALTKARKAERLRIPPCTKCGRSTRWKPIEGQTGKPYEKCNRCCWPFERKQRQARRRRQLRDARIAAAAKPRKLRPPLKPAVRVGLERLCLTPGCDTVLTHRKKICTKCQRDREAKARELLTPWTGRGRRTDLERSAAA